MAAAAAIAGRNLALKLKQQKKKKGSQVDPNFASAASLVIENPNAWKEKFVSEKKYLKQYLKIGAKAYRIIHNDTFNGFVIVVICLAGILVGLQTYESLEDSPVISLIDDIILFIFGFELILKLIATGNNPLSFITSEEKYWNIFDFIVVLMSLPVFSQLLSSGQSNSAGLLRLIRLLRVMKLVKKIPKLQIIVMGLVGGVKSIGYILVLLLLVFYLYAIIGIEFFAVNDPLHFGSLEMSMVTLFRICTLEDWTDIMYINIFGCASEKYPSGVYTTKFDAAVDYGAPYFCDQRKSSRSAVSSVYFVSFVVVSALVILSLFVGAVTMSMAESMAQMKEEIELKEKKRKMEKAAQRTKKASMKTGNMAAFHAEIEKVRASLSAEDANSFSRLSIASAMEEGMPDENISPRLDGEKRTFRGLATLVIGVYTFIRNIVDQEDEESAAEHERVKISFLQAWNGIEVDDSGKLLVNSLTPGSENLRKAYALPGFWYSFDFYKGLWIVLGEKAELVVKSAVFNNFIIIVILVAGVVVGLQTYPSLSGSSFLHALDTGILVIFSIEVLLKTVAEGLCPWKYFIKRKSLQKWNIFDYIVVVGSLLPGSGSMLTILRLLRLLRVLKLVKSLPALQIIVVALIKGVSSITYIGVILLLVFYFFSIIGMILFQENDPWHFGDLLTSLLTMFRLATMEDWTDVMYINIFGCDKYGYGEFPQYCKSPVSQPAIAAMYFIIFIFIGALVLMTLFIGVVTTSMEEATEQQQEEQSLLRRLEEIKDEKNLSEEEIEMYKTVFNMLDLDGGGTIEEEELKLGLESINQYPGKARLRELVSAVDEDGSGEIDLVEFVEFMLLIKAKRKQKIEN
eukprot:augustus_masked-scaffold_2-processed-gene-1.9-mRNA-1 protein AED:0.18 eAED:0.18 QI:0/-1/0/1/-1/1/1/0/853